MPREKTEFKRKSFIRETQKLFIIATEGQKTEVKYFEEFKTNTTLKVKGAIILVELDDDKVYQVDISSGDVIQYLNIITMKQKDFKLSILDKPLIGITLSRVLNDEIRKDKENCKIISNEINIYSPKDAQRALSRKRK